VSYRLASPRQQGESLRPVAHREKIKRKYEKKGKERKTTKVRSCKEKDKT
jgi:hypothetical protein